MSLPAIQIDGNVQRIEQRFTQDGKAITKVSISCGDKKKDGTYDNFYIDATFWENSADFVGKNYQEGSAISVRGELVTTHYEKDGKKIYKTDIRYPRVVFLPRDRVQQPQQQGHSTAAGMNDPSQIQQQQYNQSQNPPPAQHLTQQNQNTMPNQQVPGTQIPLEVQDQTIPF